MTRKRLRILLSVWLFIGYSALSDAQETKLPSTYNSYLFGWGASSVYDTYLSPLQYKGNNFSFLFEQTKMTGLGKGNVARQHLLNIDFSYTENESQTAKKYTGMLEYGYSLLYKFKPVDRFVFMAGLKADALIGFVYNTRNGNNPATPKVNVNLGLSALASYPIYMKDNLILLRYQLSLPFAGVMYAHDYGQSYYEIDMENYKGVFRFASFHNQLMMRNVLSVEFPSKHAYTFKLAYMNNLYETRVNDLDTQWWINSFLIGVSYNFITVPGKKVHSDYYHTIFNQP